MYHHTIYRFYCSFAGLKKFLSIALLILLSFSIFLKLGIVINWKINQDTIAKNLCENRDKPKMCCKGKCQLKKQLQKVDSESQQDKKSTEEKSKTGAMDLFFTENNYNINHTIGQIAGAAFYAPTNENYHFCFHSKNIKPPIVIAA
jgi:hypothetical protein